jgi:hypothetical protein
MASKMCFIIFGGLLVSIGSDVISQKIKLQQAKFYRAESLGKTKVIFPVVKLSPI